MASSTQSMPDPCSRNLKRTFDSFSETNHGPAYENVVSKRRALELYLPASPAQNHLQPLTPAFNSSTPDSLGSTDTLYDYPGLEQDMSNIFDVNSSFTPFSDPLSPSNNGFDLQGDLSGQLPPSSVIRNLDRTSRSCEDFDPNLQHSSPDSSELASTQPFHDEGDQLGEDVDWDQVMQDVKPLGQNIASFATGSSQTLLESAPGKISHSSNPNMPWLATRNFMPISTPNSSHNASSTGSPTSGLLLRLFKTFFKVKDLLSHKAELFKNQPRAVFELFARIVYTSRDRSGRKQYFQLRDLFAQSPPYLSGTLVN